MTQHTHMTAQHSTWQDTTPTWQRTTHTNTHPHHDGLVWRQRLQVRKVRFCKQDKSAGWNQTQQQTYRLLPQDAQKMCKDRSNVQRSFILPVKIIMSFGIHFAQAYTKYKSVPNYINQLQAWKGDAFGILFVPVCYNASSVPNSTLIQESADHVPEKLARLWLQFST